MLFIDTTILDVGLNKFLPYFIRFVAQSLIFSPIILTTLNYVITVVSSPKMLLDAIQLFVPSRIIPNWNYYFSLTNPQRRH
jgi:hypothetical protein